MSDNKRIGIILANTGSPIAPTPDAVRSYLERFLTDPRIVPMNPRIWSQILHRFILPKRSVASAEKYQKIWTMDGAPLDVAARGLAAKLEALLCENGTDARVVAAMSYGSPTYDEALAQLKDAGCERFAAVPLYPQSAYSTTESVRDNLTAAFERTSPAAPLAFIDRYEDNAAYIKAVASSLRKAGFGAHDNDQLLVAYHSIPMKDIEAGDTYPAQCERTCALLLEELGMDPADHRWMISYQCRFDKERTWLSPFTADVLPLLAQNGGRLFMVCPGFSLDCLETLYDIPQEIEPAYRAARAEAGFPASSNDFIYVPCLNDSDDHAQALASVLAPYLDAAHEE